jgi:hypothetical protein
MSIRLSSAQHVTVLVGLGTRVAVSHHGFQWCTFLVFMQVIVSSDLACGGLCEHRLGDNVFSSVLAACSRPCSDQWRLQLLRIVHNAATMSCSQAAALLGCFQTQQISDPIQVLLRSLHDVSNIAIFEAAAQGCRHASDDTDLLDAYEQLGYPSGLLIARNPSGHYELDLAKQVASPTNHACSCSYRMPITSIDKL